MTTKLETTPIQRDMLNIVTKAFLIAALSGGFSLQSFGLDSESFSQYRWIKVHNIGEPSSDVRESGATGEFNESVHLASLEPFFSGTASQNSVINVFPDRVEISGEGHISHQGDGYSASDFVVEFVLSTPAVLHYDFTTSAPGEAAQAGIQLQNFAEEDIIKLLANASANGQILLVPGYYFFGGGALGARSDAGEASWKISFILSDPISTPEEAALSDFIAQVAALSDVHHGIRDALGSKLQAALANITNGDQAEACADLQSFIHLAKAQRGKNLSPPVADALITQATELKALFGCP